MTNQQRIFKGTRERGGKGGEGQIGNMLSLKHIHIYRLNIINK